MGVLSASVTALLLLVTSYSGLPVVATSGPRSPSETDPCTSISGSLFARPADALACQRSFVFNETLRQNVLSVVEGVFDFFTFEDYYVNSPPPFQSSTVNIRAEIQRINSTHYDTDYDFNRDLYNFVNRLNDGHTQWVPNCYTTWENLLPTPIVSLDVDGAENIYIVPDAVDFVSLIPPGFTSFYDSIGLDWRRLAGAKVLQIEGMDPYDYVDTIADTFSGNFLDHGVRINSVYSGYRLQGSSFSQKFGDFAGQLFSTTDNVTFVLIPANATTEETVTVPYLMVFMGDGFTDSESYWANNCAANGDTNGVDKRLQASLVAPKRLSPRAVVRSPADAIGLPSTFQPSLPPVNSPDGVVQSYILPDAKTGVIFVGSFEGDQAEFESDIATAVSAFKHAGVDRVLIDLSNNPGGFICLGFFLHSYLAGGAFGYPAFESTIRAHPLAMKISQADLLNGISPALAYYAPGSFAFLNNSVIPSDLNFLASAFSLKINNQIDSISQPLHDICSFNTPIPATPPFDLKNVAIVSNGNCASTCAMFSTLMFERHNSTIAVFGGKTGLDMEYKGMAGNQVLDWTELDSEIKTAGLKDDPLAPPDLLVNANMRHNWRTAYSWLDESTPIEYRSEHPTLRFPYTMDTYIDPQQLWIFACVISCTFASQTADELSARARYLATRSYTIRFSPICTPLTPQPFCISLRHRFPMIGHSALNLIYPVCTLLFFALLSHPACKL
ncbi:hypothetical protein OF83DRAFT_1057662 [Amylostereum chailletii]|nr:hypothetical protein OF83DRAFT_1057662 [Amylostereum chailletii]